MLPMTIGSTKQVIGRMADSASLHCAEVITKQMRDFRWRLTCVELSCLRPMTVVHNATLDDYSVLGAQSS